MSLSPWFRQLFRRASSAPREPHRPATRRRPAGFRPGIEILEDRTAPAGLVAFTSGPEGAEEIYVMNPDGTGVTNVSNNPARDYDAAWSPDGTKLAFTSSRDGQSEIYVMNADGSGQTRLTNNPAEDIMPEWAPDGRIVFATNRDGNLEIYAMNADGSSPTNLTNHSATDFEPTVRSTDGRIAFTSERTGGLGIFTMNADGSGLVQMPTNATYSSMPAWSPDGTKLAYSKFVFPGPNQDIFVMNADGSGDHNITNTGNNQEDEGEPAWSPDGTQIVYAKETDGGQWLDIFVMNADGSGNTQLTANPGIHDRYPSWAVIDGGAGVQNGELAIIGTDAADEVNVRFTDGGKAFRVTANFLPGGFQDFSAAGITSVRILLGGGDDRATMAGRIDLPAILDGGAGNDFLQSDGGAGILLGGEGNDELNGRGGRNLLIGGAGADLLFGRGDEDLLIAGTTAFDADATALAAIVTKWQSTDEAYEQRVANLQNVGVLNGSVKLIADGPERTVFDDAAADRLTGGAGKDWFFANLNSGVLDTITDRKAAEFSTELV